MKRDNRDERNGQNVGERVQTAQTAEPERENTGASKVSAEEGAYDMGAAVRAAVRLLDDEEFVKEYVLDNPTVERLVIEAYLRGMRKGVPSVPRGGSPLSPQTRPKTLLPQSRCGRLGGSVMSPAASGTRYRCGSCRWVWLHGRLDCCTKKDRDRPGLKACCPWSPMNLVHSCHMGHFCRLMMDV